MWYGVCGGWLLSSTVHANKAITIVVCQPLPAGETSQVKGVRESGEDGRGEGRGLGFKSKNMPFFIIAKHLVFSLKRSAFSIFDVLLYFNLNCQVFEANKNKA